ncbi:NusG domain II-containing protein [Proteinivorax hydrogeniformans]|uniref:NusG domain II-containing protein n=1 Tax=Proteinivorax hydrogeniformans TaxID=1826727 RepID=A0AAU8HRB5_9FIRM
MKQGDKILVLSIGLFAVAFMIFFGFVMNSEPGEYVVVSIDGEKVLSFAINNDTEALNYHFQFEEDKWATLISKEGKVKMERMSKEDYPQQICCSLTGWISTQSEQIVCLPNKILVNLS